MTVPESKVVFDRTKMERFKSKDYRNSYVSTRVRSSIAWQIRELRESSRMSQSELAKRIGTRQSAVSRLENTEYGRASVQTLLDVATALDVALVVRFVSYDEFLFQHGNMNPSALSVETFSSTYERYANQDTQNDTHSKLLKRILARRDANSVHPFSTITSESQTIGNISRHKAWSAQAENRNSYYVGADKALPRRETESVATVVMTQQERAA